MHLLPGAVGKLSIEQQLSEIGLIEPTLLKKAESFQFEIVLAKEPCAKRCGEVPGVVLQLRPRVIHLLFDHSVELMQIEQGRGRNVMCRVMGNSN